jgi:hypothetical protein
VPVADAQAGKNLFALLPGGPNITQTPQNKTGCLIGNPLICYGGVQVAIST